MMTTMLRKNFEGTIDIHDVKDFVLNYELDNKIPLWIEFDQVTGVDYDLIRKDKLINPDREFPEDEDEDEHVYFADLALREVLILSYIYQHKEQNTLEYLRVHDMPDIIKKITRIACDLYEISAAFIIPESLQLFTKKNIRECVDVMMSAYEEADIYGKALLSVTCLWTFDVLYCKDYYTLGEEGAVSMEVLTLEQQAFMNRMYECGLKYNNSPEDDLKKVRELRLQEWQKEYTCD